MTTATLASPMSLPGHVVIDLTEDESPDPFQETKPFQKDSVIFVPTVAHRQPSTSINPSPTVPHKRKSVDSEDDASSPAPRSEPAKDPRSRGNVTPSPTASDKAAVVGTVSVVVPSPKQIFQKSSEPIGLSERYYPTKDPEQKKARKRDYPKANPGTRAVVPFSVTRPSLGPVAKGTNTLRDKLLDSLKSVSGPEISFPVDDQKLAMLSANFAFVNSYILREGVTPVSDDFKAGCGCDGSCSRENCGCLEQEVNSDERIVPYHSKDGLLVLRAPFLKRKSMIYECNSRCSCQGDCWNHVVQNGRQIRLEIFDTGARGFGLRSPDPVVAGQFIDCYLGEVITKKEADARELADQQGQSYLFCLDFVEDNENIYVIDGQKFGSPTRFINHSCNPNCKIIPMSTDHAETRLYYLAFFALRNIPAGTELTFDYNPSWDGSKKVDPDAVKCLCGEKKCRGQLWPNSRKTQTSSKDSP